MDEPPLPSCRSCPIVVIAMGLGLCRASDRGGRRIFRMERVDTTFHCHIEHSAARSFAPGEVDKACRVRNVRSATKPKLSLELRNALQQRTNEVAEAKEQLAQREAELEETRAQLSQQGGAHVAGTPQDELAALLRVPNVKAVSLTGSDLAKHATGFLLYDSRTQKAWLYSVNLPECPAGTTYQLWAIRDKPISIGTFQMDTGKTAHLLVKKVLSFMDAKTFAVSLEPSGGRPQPTGPIYLLSRS